MRVEAGMLEHMQVAEIAWLAAAGALCAVLLVAAGVLGAMISLLVWWLVFREQPVFSGCPDGVQTQLFRYAHPGAHCYDWQAQDEPATLYRRKERESMFLRLVAKHGKTLRFEGMTATCDPALMKELLTRKAHTLPRSILYRVLATILPSFDGILSSSGSEWKRRHRIFTPLFTGSAIASYAGVMHDAITAVAQFAAPRKEARRQWAVAAAGLWQPTSPAGMAMKPVQLPEGGGWDPGALGDEAYAAHDLLTLVRFASMRVLMAWGMGLDVDSPNARKLGKEFHYYVTLLQDVLPYCGIGTKAWVYAQLWVSASRMSSVVQEIVNGNGHKHQPGPNFITAMLDDGFTHAELVSELNHIHGAHKAVALAIAMAVYELSAPGNEGWRQAVKDEFKAVLGSRSHPERSDLGEMPVLRAVRDEVLRLHVVSFGTMRKTGADIQHAGKTIKAGSEMQLWLHALHRHPDHWDQPEVFDPHRFLRGDEQLAVEVPSRKTATQPVGMGTYYPFLDGQRRCAGIHLAKLEWAVMMHALLVRWDVRTTVPHGTLRKYPDMFVGLEGPLTYTMNPKGSYK